MPTNNDKYTPPPKENHCLSCGSKQITYTEMEYVDDANNEIHMSFKCDDCDEINKEVYYATYIRTI